VITAEREITQCHNCGRTLSQHTSVREGMGPVCRGWSWDPQTFRRRLRVIERDSAWIRFRVKSWTNDKERYSVEINTETGQASCSCPQFTIRKQVCKHLLQAVGYVRRNGRN
jgi:hypothetical protein